MFGKLKQLQNQLDGLKTEVYGPEEKKEKRLFGLSLAEWHGLYPRYTLKQRVDDLQKILEQQENLSHLILENLGLEYVKVTEENGEKKVVEKLRPISKKKIGKKNKQGDCECCDYAD